MSFAFGTRVRTPNGFRKIEEFNFPGEVLAAAIVSTGVKIDWAPAKVLFSNGTGPESFQSSMAFLKYGAGEGLVCTVGQPLLLWSGKLATAEILEASDKLVSGWGTPITLRDVTFGGYEGGIHHIITRCDLGSSEQGHLIEVEGIVVGDLMLEMRYPRLDSATRKTTHTLD